MAILGILAAALVAGAVLPQQGFDCREPSLREDSPDGHHSLTVCRQPMFFAMPGQGSDAPGLVVLRDAQGTVEGVVQLAMVNEIDRPPEWTTNSVGIPLSAEFDLTRESTLPRWLANAGWRWRSWLGLLPDSAEFR